jgi:hypothetical protein
VKIPALAVLLVTGAAAPAKDYATYIGDAFSYHVAALTTDAVGNTYVTGSRAISSSVPGTTPVSDIFVAKLDPSGNLLMTVTLSGKASDQANAITLDSAGNIFKAGGTSSVNFPLLNPLQSAPAGGFLAKSDPKGKLMFSTYLGGTRGSGSLSGVAVDSNGDVYVTGTTAASDYPHTPGLPASGVAFGGDRDWGQERHRLLERVLRRSRARAGDRRHPDQLSGSCSAEPGDG